MHVEINFRPSTEKQLSKKQNFFPYVFTHNYDDLLSYNIFTEL